MYTQPRSKLSNLIEVVKQDVRQATFTLYFQTHQAKEGLLYKVFNK
jgi:hypothetical protein